MSYCVYYQAKVNKSLTWFFVATFRSFEHLAFDRTFDVENGIFEFFVPQDLETIFIDVMNYYKNIEIISGVKKMPNRFNSCLENI